MAKKWLEISPDLKLPLDAATETFGILGKKGSGKSNAAVVMAEEMWEAEIPWVAIDPKGDWWGLRASGDGEGPGLPLPVFGGRHGDIPLEPSAGPMVADLILDQMLTCVLDVSEFSKAEVTKFLTAFGERLYRQAEDEPLHLFLEEAHEYLPQRVMSGEARLVGVWQKLVKQGRFKGLGCTLVTQRSASLNKDVLTQVDTLITLQATSPQDRAAVKGWVDVHAGSADMLDTLPSLKKGEAWFWHPEERLLPTGQLVKIQFRRRHTFDSGATPKVGQKRRAPATLADVDLDAIEKEMAETIERAKLTDPKALQARIRELEGSVSTLQKKNAAVTLEKIIEVEKEVEVRVPYIPQEIADLIYEGEKKIEEIKDDFEREIDTALDVMAGIRERMEGFEATREHVEKVSSPKPVSKTPAPKTLAPTPARTMPIDPDVRITGGAIRMLEALYLAPGGTLSKVQVGLLSNMKSTSGTFSNYLSTLRVAGLIETNSVGVALTQAGYDWFDEPPPVLTPEALRDMWREKLRGGEVRMFDALVDIYPDGLTRPELAERVEMAMSGTYSNYLSKLRTSKLVVEENGLLQANPDLF